MPWQKTDAADPKWLFVQAALRRRVSMAELCRHFGISRECGHKWLRRFMVQGASGLTPRSHRSRRAEKLQQQWQQRVMQVRRERPTWGAHKLRWLLQRRYPGRALPGQRTIARWLKAAQQVRRPVRWSRAGPVVLRRHARLARAPNEVWTVDFKGWFRVADGQRVCALTVRDLATRFVLSVRHMVPTERAVRTHLLRLFRRYGLPRAMRTDNGAPFGGRGALGLSSLSAWWLRLGIAVQFGRPRCPQDNGAHEQMHRVLQAETAQPPAPTLPAQQQRFDRWRKDYNAQRPHAALADQVPAKLYRPSTQRFPTGLPPWRYPSDWDILVPNAKGVAWWHGRQRMFGRAFHGHCLGLEPMDAFSARVFFGPHLIGSIHRTDLAGLRPARWRNLGSGKGGSQAPSLKPSP